MEAPSDVVALFHSSFHPTRGNIVDFQLKVRDDVNLDGVEFSSLPSGLHLVDQDVIHFTKDGLCGIAVFRRRRIRENGMRGVRLGAVGVLIGSAPRARPWLHLPHLKRLAAHLEATPEDWEPLTEYYESHRQPDIVPSTSAIEIPELWSGWEHELATASPNHPLHHLPCLLHAFGPNIMTLFRFVLARRRVLIYTRVPAPASRSGTGASFNSISSRLSNASQTEGSVVDQAAVDAGAAPVVEPACVLARVAADICFGWRSELEIPGLGGAGLECAEGGAIPVLGMVGLDAIERLGEDSLKRSGWIACTTERIFLEKPHLYDLVVDLSPSLLAHAPSGPSISAEDRPVLSVSVPASGSTTTLSSSAASYKLAPTRPTYSDLRVFNDVERALYAQTSYPHSHAPPTPSAQPNPTANMSTTSFGYAREVEDGWVVWDRWGEGCTPGSHAHFVPGNRDSCAAGTNSGPCSSGLNSHALSPSEQNGNPSGSAGDGTTAEVLRAWVDPWKIYEGVCMFCAGVCGWIGLGPRDRDGSAESGQDGGVRLEGPDEALRRTGTGLGEPKPEGEGHELTETSSPEQNLDPTSPTDPNFTSNVNAVTITNPGQTEARRAMRRAHVLELMTLFHKYAAFLHARLGDIVDSYEAVGRKHKSSTGSKFSVGSKSSTGTKSSSGSKVSGLSFKSAFSSSKSQAQTQALLPDNGVVTETLVLTSKDMVALELSPLSTADAQFLEWLAESVVRSSAARRVAGGAVERKVVVKRTWKDMVVAVVGSSW